MAPAGRDRDDPFRHPDSEVEVPRMDEAAEARARNKLVALRELEPTSDPLEYLRKALEILGVPASEIAAMDRDTLLELSRKLKL